MRVLASLVLGLHLVGVLVGPLSVPPSILADFFRTFYRPYLGALYLDHGYKFFAPNPGPSHLVRYELEMPDGTHQKGTFPDIDSHRPRLLYHRHFMLSEFLNALPEVEEPPVLEDRQVASIPANGRPTGAEEDVAPPQAKRPRARRAEVPKMSAEMRAYAASYARHLLETHGARRVRLELVEHLIPSPQDVLDEMRLDDKRLYRTRPLGWFERQQP